MNYCKYMVVGLLLCVCLTNDQEPNQQQLDAILEKSMEIIWQQAMQTKFAINETRS